MPSDAATAPDGGSQGVTTNPPILNEQEQAKLRAIAERAIVHGARNRTEPPDDWHTIVGDSDRLLERRGVFVTVYVGDELHGCLGEIDPYDGLAPATARCAAHATYADGRFSPVRERELPDLSYKISVMTPLQPVASTDAIVIGRDGLLVRHERRLGLLLPDVPVEYGWDVPTFLKHLWRKAGFPPDLPLEAVTLASFQTQIIPGQLPATDEAPPANA